MICHSPVSYLKNDVLSYFASVKYCRNTSEAKNVRTDNIPTNRTGRHLKCEASKGTGRQAEKGG
jgi:hypothetical protein